jgi:hypothetical protein
MVSLLHAPLGLHPHLAGANDAGHQFGAEALRPDSSCDVGGQGASPLIFIMEFIDKDSFYLISVYRAKHAQGRNINL